MNLFKFQTFNSEIKQGFLVKMSALVFIYIYIYQTWVRDLFSETPFFLTPG